MAEEPWIDEGFESGTVGNRLTAAALPPSYAGSSAVNVGPPIVATTTSAFTNQMLFGSASAADGTKHAEQSFSGASSTTVAADIVQWSGQTFGGGTPYSIYSNGWKFLTAVRLDRRATNVGAGASIITSFAFTSTVLDPMRIVPVVDYRFDTTDRFVVYSLRENPTPIATVTPTLGQWYLFDIRVLAVQNAGDTTKADVTAQVDVTPAGSSPVVTWSKTYSAASDWDSFNGVGKESSLNVRRYQLGASSATHNAKLSYDGVYVAFNAALTDPTTVADWGVDRIAW